MKGSTLSRRIRWVMVAGLMTLTCVALVPAVAAAKPRDGKCDGGEFCYYFNSDRKGAVSDFSDSLGQYGDKQPNCYEFRGGGNGNGKCVKNNAAYVWNRTDKVATVFFNSNFGGATQVFEPGASGNLRPGMKNQNASHRLDPKNGAPCGPGRACPVDPGPDSGGKPAPGGVGAPAWVSPVPAGQYVTARWMYKKRKNRKGSLYHGAWDIGGKYTVKSACNGYVSNVDVKRGKLGNLNSNGDSGTTNYIWIRCDGDRVQMGYAHFFAKDKPGWIKRGARVRAGQRLFPTGNQGNSSGYHLHFQITRDATDRRPNDGKDLNPLNFMRSKGVKDFPA